LGSENITAIFSKKGSFIVQKRGFGRWKKERGSGKEGSPFLGT